MSLGQRSITGMLTGAGSVLIKTGLNILIIPVLIAKLGLEAFGLYLLLIAVFEIALLLDMGATSAIVTLLGNEANADDANRRRTLKVGNILLSGMALLFWITGMALAPWFSSVFNITPNLQAIAQTGVLLIITEAALTLYSCYSGSVLLAHCSHQWTNIADTAYNLIANIGALIALFTGYGLVEIMALRLIGTLIRLGIMSFHTFRLEPAAFFPKVPFCMEAAQKLTRLSGHAMMINVSIIVSHKIDDLVIARFLPLSAVGIYEIVFRFLGITIQVCLKLYEGLYPLFSKLAAQGDKAQARLLFLRMSSLLNLTACLMLMLIVVYYVDLFAIFSAGKIPMRQTLPILALAVPCVLSGVLQMPANAFLFTWGQQRFLTVTSILAAVANLILSVWLVQVMGLTGVALGTLIPQLIQHQLGLVGQANRTLGISTTHYLKSVHGAILGPLLVSFLWTQLWSFTIRYAIFPLLPISLIGISTLFLGGILWFQWTATPTERQLLAPLLKSRLARSFFPSLSTPTMDNA